MQDFIRTWGPWLLLAVNLVIALAMYAVRSSIATKEDVGAITARLAKVEQAHESAPTPAQFAELRLEIERMRGEVKGWIAEVRGARETLRAEQDGLRQLVVRTENMVGIIHEHELRRGAGG